MEPFADAPAWAAALEASSLGVLMRGSFMLYPLANLGHIFGLILFAGSVVILDLRLLGLWRREVDAEALSQALSPVIFVGLALLATTGLMLLSADARPLTVNPAFRVKAALLLLGVSNALLFRRLWHRFLPHWDGAAPGLARLQVAASLAIWLMVASAGRLIGYL